MIILDYIFWIGLFLVFYTYVLYSGLLFLLARYKKPKFKSNGEYFPTVTMIIPAYNEEAIIRQKMDNCRRLEYPEGKLEILIGSDGSTDNTNQLIEQYAPPNVKLLSFTENRGKSKVLTDLVAHAKGEILVFSDANTIFNPHAISTLVHHFSQSGVGAVCGRLILINPNGNVGGWGEARYWKYENIIKKLEGEVSSTIGATGGIYAIRRNLFPTLPVDRQISDDLVISLLIIDRGYKVLFEKEAIAVEATTRSFQEEFNRKKRIGVCNFQALPLIANCLNPQKGFVAFALWSHKILRWFAPLILIVLFILNITLLGKPIYNVIFGSQCLFYGFAFIGYWIKDRKKKPSFISYPLYFAMANIALFFALVEILGGKKKAQWETTKR